MFGMSSKEFWEEEPQLYWAYRFSYEKEQEFIQKKEMEELKLVCWLQGKTTEIAVSIALNNAFSKKKQTFPTFEEFYKGKDSNRPINEELEKLLDGVEDKEERASIEFNYWARI